MKTLFAFTLSLILVLFYAFFLELFYSLMALITHYGYAPWAKGLLILTALTFTLIPLYLIFYTWKGFGSGRPEYYSWIGKKCLHGFLTMILIASLTYAWTNYYDRLIHSSTSLP